MKDIGKKWKLISRNIVYDGSPYLKIFIDVIKLPNGKIINNYHRIEISNAVILLIENNEKILVYKEYRHGINDVSLTFPAGGIEDNETAIDAAKRELLEETGYDAKNFNLINNYIVSGSYRFSELSYISVTGIKKIADPVAEDMENPEKIWMNRQQVKLALKNKKFIGLTYATAALHWIQND